MIKRIEELLRNNQAFVEAQLRLDASYFDKLAEGHSIRSSCGSAAPTAAWRPTASPGPTQAICSCTGTSRT